MEKELFKYDNVTTRNFLVATIIWGVIAFLVGVTAAIQLFTRTLI